MSYSFDINNIIGVLKNSTPLQYNTNYSFDPSQFRRVINISNSSNNQSNQNNFLKSRDQIEEEKRQIKEIDFLGISSESNNNAEDQIIELLRTYNVSNIPEISSVTIEIPQQDFLTLLSNGAKSFGYGSTLTPGQKIIITERKIIPAIIDSFSEFFKPKPVIYYKTIDTKNNPSKISFYIATSNIVNNPINQTFNDDEILSLSSQSASVNDLMETVEKVKNNLPSNELDRRSNTKILSEITGINLYNNLKTFLAEIMNYVPEMYQVQIFKILIGDTQQHNDPITSEFLSKINMLGWNLFFSDREKNKFIYELSSSYPYRKAAGITAESILNDFISSASTQDINILTEKIVSILPLITGSTLSYFLIHLLTQSPTEKKKGDGKKKETFFAIPKDKVNLLGPKKNEFLTGILNGLKSIGEVYRNAQEQDVEESVIKLINQILNTINFNSLTGQEQSSFVKKVVNFVVSNKLSITLYAYQELSRSNLFSQYDENKEVKGNQKNSKKELSNQRKKQEDTFGGNNDDVTAYDSIADPY